MILFSDLTEWFSVNQIEDKVDIDKAIFYHFIIQNLFWSYLEYDKTTLCL